MTGYSKFQLYDVEMILYLCRAIHKELRVDEYS